jgi:hypothetical protein
VLSTWNTILTQNVEFPSFIVPPVNDVPNAIEIIEADDDWPLPVKATPDVSPSKKRISEAFRVSSSS